MSKINHRRTIVTRKDSERYSGSPMGDIKNLSVLADRSIAAGWGGDNSNGHRGYGYVKRGAKKFVRSRTRFHENAVTQRLAQDEA